MRAMPAGPTAVALEVAPDLDEPAGRRVGRPTARQWPWDGNGNGHAAARDRGSLGTTGSLQGPGGLALLRRMRLDHGPQRQLLQVPQLRLDARLQLRRRTRGAGSPTSVGHGPSAHPTHERGRPGRPWPIL